MSNSRSPMVASSARNTFPKRLAIRKSISECRIWNVSPLSWHCVSHSVNFPTLQLAYYYIQGLLFCYYSGISSSSTPKSSAAQAGIMRRTHWLLIDTPRHVVPPMTHRLGSTPAGTCGNNMHIYKFTGACVICNADKAVDLGLAKCLLKSCSRILSS